MANPIKNDQELVEIIKGLAEGREQVRRFAEALATEHGKTPEQVRAATRAASAILDDTEEDINNYLKDNPAAQSLITKEFLRAIQNMRGPYDYSRTQARLDEAHRRTQEALHKLKKPPGVPFAEVYDRIMQDPEMQEINQAVAEKVKEFIDSCSQPPSPRVLLDFILGHYDLQLPEDIPVLYDSLDRLFPEFKDLWARFAR